MKYKIIIEKTNCADRLSADFVRQMENAREWARRDPDFKIEDCGCCHNAVITTPYKNDDGNYQIDISVGDTNRIFSTD